jgi:hypothetical protein
MLEIMASLWRIFEARNTYALSKFHREHMHLGIDNASFGFGGLVRKYRHSTRTSPFLKNPILKLAGGKSRSSALEHGLPFHIFFLLYFVSSASC